MSRVDIILNAKKIALLLAMLVMCLTALHVVGNLIPYYLGRSGHGLMPMFDLDAEANIPALYSALALIFCSALLMLIASVTRQQGHSHYSWIGLAVLFLVLSVDEALALHERLSISDAARIVYSAWMIPASVLAALVLWIYGRFLMNLPARARWLFCISALVYFFGILIVDLAGGLHFKSHGVDTVYLIMATIEEVLEMAAVVVFIYALLSYIGTEFRGLRLSIASS